VINQGQSHSKFSK